MLRISGNRVGVIIVLILVLVLKMLVVIVCFLVGNYRWVVFM